MSTTNKQSDLIDFLWEWTKPLGDWSKLLVQNVINKNGELNESERTRVFNYYLQNIGFQFSPPLPPLSISKPVLKHVSKEVFLTKLSEIKGVNRLDSSQILEFSPNITVIYGNNGVGKTGYSRLLKSQGYSFDDNIDILYNVHEQPEGQSARFEFTSDGDPFYLDWKGGRTISDLNSISVFNNDCVNISLSNNRELLVTPKGFHIFSLITEELSRLSSMHAANYVNYPVDLPWVIQLHNSTPQKIFIDNLKYNSSEEKLDEISRFNENDQSNLTSKEKELSALNKQSIEAKIREVNFIIHELDSAISKIKDTKDKLSKHDWINLISYKEQLKLLKARTQIGIAGLAKEFDLEKYESIEFLSFLKSADAYIKLLAKKNYPNNEHDTCVYCRQEIQSEEARSLLESYNKILNDTTAREISKYENLINEIINRTRLIDYKIELHHPAFGTKEDKSIIQPQELINFNSSIKSIKDHILNNTAEEKIPFNINYDSLLIFLETRQKSLVLERIQLKDTVGDLSKIENKLQSEIDELNDRKLFSIKKSQILDVISNLNAHRILNENKSKFNTTSLSVKTSQARNELVTQDFQNKFNSELVKFRKQHLNVNLSFHSKQGNSMLKQNVANYDINKVLSEGEQKTIALCEFLTELQLDGAVAPVVFDDPVNSLDHHIISDVAKRLMELSKERQVIVFTHNVIFYNAFFALQKNILNKDIAFKYYMVSSNSDKTGILSDGAPINKLSTFKSKLNVICKNEIGDKNENYVAAEGYAYLRTALELFVSNTVFKEIVGRYRSNIMMTKFPEVKGDMIDVHKAEIDAIFSRASGFIEAHSHPEEQHNPPTMADLKADFSRFEEIESQFK